VSSQVNRRNCFYNYFTLVTVLGVECYNSPDDTNIYFDHHPSPLMKKPVFPALYSSHMHFQINDFSHLKWGLLILAAWTEPCRWGWNLPAIFPNCASFIWREAANDWLFGNESLQPQASSDLSQMRIFPCRWKRSTFFATCRLL
jgi:hypothetical protein